MEFKMERTGLLDEGERVTLTEGTLPSSCYYTLDSKRAKSLAMSPNVPFSERLKSRSGVVKSIEERERGFYVTVEIDEEPDSVSDRTLVGYGIGSERISSDNKLSLLEE